MSSYVFGAGKMENGTRGDVEGQGKWKTVRKRRQKWKSYTRGISSSVLLCNKVCTHNNNISYTWKFVKWVELMLSVLMAIDLKNNNNIPTIQILVLTRLNLSGEWCLILYRESARPQNLLDIFCFVISALLPSSFWEKGGLFVNKTNIQCF